MALELTTSYMKDAIAIFRQYKKLGDGAIRQCPDDRLTATLDPESNSVAILVKHVAGNMRSRWTDFLATDGEKPDRDRDSEFKDPPTGRAELVALWRPAVRPRRLRSRSHASEPPAKRAVCLLRTQRPMSPVMNDGNRSSVSGDRGISQ